MDQDSFKVAVKAAGFHKDIEKVKLDGNKLTVVWTSKNDKKKKHEVTLSAATAAMDQSSANFVKAAAKEFSDNWDATKKNDD